MGFVKIKGRYALGFQNPSLIDEEMKASMNALASFEEFAASCFSPARVAKRNTCFMVSKQKARGF